MTKPKIVVEDIENESGNDSNDDVDYDSNDETNATDKLDEEENEEEEDEEEEEDIEAASVSELITMTLKTLSPEQVEETSKIIEHLNNPMTQYEAINLLVQHVVNVKNTPSEGVEKFKIEVLKYKTDYMNYSSQNSMKVSLNKKLFAYEYVNNAIEGGVPCPSCKSTSTVARRVQTAGADESTAFILRCTRCNYAGKTA